jgi:hypothetical protein
MTIPRKDALKPRPRLGTAQRSLSPKKLTVEQTDAESILEQPASAVLEDGQVYVGRGGILTPETISAAAVEGGAPGSHAANHAKGASDDLVAQDVNVRTLTLEDIDASPVNDVLLRVIDGELQVRNGTGTIPATTSYLANIFRALAGGNVVARLQAGSAGTNMIELRDSAGIEGGHLKLARLQFDALRATSSTLTIASGAVTRTRFYHTIDTEGAAGTDDLDTLNGGLLGDLLLIRPANDARTVVVKHLTGNIRLNGNADLSLDEEDDFLLLLFTGSQWWEVSRNVAGGGGGHTIRNEGSDLTARTGLNLRGGLVAGVDDAAGDETEVRVGMQPDGTDLFATADTAPHLTVGATGKISRLLDVLEFTDSSTPTAIAGFTRVYAGGGLLRQSVVIGGLSFNFAVGGPAGLLSDQGQLGGWSAGLDAVDGAWGMARPVTVTGTPTFAATANGCGATFPTAASIAAVAGIELQALPMAKNSALGILVKFDLDQTTDTRFFCGVTNQTLATMVAADNPAGSYVGLSYSTPRGDTNFRWINKDNTTQRNNDTGIAVDTAVHYLQVLSTGTTFVASLFNSSFVLQDAQLFALNPPAPGTALGFVLGLETQVAGVKSIGGYYFTIFNNR